MRHPLRSFVLGTLVSLMGFFGVANQSLAADPPSTQSQDAFREELESLLNAWNTARNAGDTAAQAELFRLEDRQEILNAPVKGQSNNAQIKIQAVIRKSDSSARIRYTRTWGGPRAGRVNAAIEAELIDGKWQLALPSRSVVVKTPPAPQNEVLPPALASTAPPLAAVAAASPVIASPVAASPAASAAPAVAERRVLGETQVIRVKPIVGRAVSPAVVVAAEAPLMPTNLNVGVGRVTLVRLPIAVSRVAVGDPSIADFTVVSPTELYVLGKSVGTTNMILWDRSDKSHMFDASVSIDLSPLRSSLTEALPRESDIRVAAASGSVVLTGSVADTPTADAVLSLSEAYVRNLNRYLQTSASGGTAAASGAGGGAAVASSATGAAGLRVINLLKIRDPQQVMLEVRIAEVSKNLLERLGFKFSSLSKVQNGGRVSEIPGESVSTEVFTGSTTILPDGSILSTPYTRTITESIGASTFQEIPGITTTYPNKLLFADPAVGALTYLLSGKKGQILDIDAQKTDDLVKILAEPTLVAMSGQEGSFLSGGQVYIPVPALAGSSPTLQQTEFGIRLKFTPTVLDGGRINLQVSPEVSEPVSLSGSQTVFSVRKVSSTVQLRDGETLVIGGLMKNNVKEIIKAFPILGELPILGVLFRSSEFQNDRTELVIVVSPTLVKASSEQPVLPTDRFVPPTRSEFFFEGKMEGSAGGAKDAAK